MSGQPWWHRFIKAQEKLRPTLDAAEAARKIAEPYQHMINAIKAPQAPFWNEEQLERAKNVLEEQLASTPNRPVEGGAQDGGDSLSESPAGEAAHRRIVEMGPALKVIQGAEVHRQEMREGDQAIAFQRLQIAIVFVYAIAGIVCVFAITFCSKEIHPGIVIALLSAAGALTLRRTK